MKAKFAANVTLSIAAAFAGQALAATNPTPSTSYSQVQAELAQANQTGERMASDEGFKLNEVYPDRYPAHAAQAKSDEQVKAELAEAKRTGDFIVGENGAKANEVNPAKYPARATPTANAPAPATSPSAGAIRTIDFSAGA